MNLREAIVSIRAALSACDQKLIEALDEQGRRIREVKSVAEGIIAMDNYTMAVARAGSDFREDVRKILKELPAYDPVG